MRRLLQLIDTTCSAHSISFCALLGLAVQLTACDSGRQLAVVVHNLPVKEASDLQSKTVATLKFGQLVGRPFQLPWESKDLQRVDVDGFVGHVDRDSVVPFPVRAFVRRFVLIEDAPTWQDPDADAPSGHLPLGEPVDLVVSAPWLSQGIAAVVRDGAPVAFIDMTSIGVDPPSEDYFLRAAISHVESNAIEPALALAERGTQLLSAPKRLAELLSALRSTKPGSLTIPRESEEWAGSCQSSRKPDPGGPAFVASPSASLRTTPNLGSPGIARLSANTFLQVHRLEGDWAEVSVAPPPRPFRTVRLAVREGRAVLLGIDTVPAAAHNAASYFGRPGTQPSDSTRGQIGGLAPDDPDAGVPRLVQDAGPAATRDDAGASFPIGTAHGFIQSAHLGDSPIDQDDLKSSYQRHAAVGRWSDALACLELLAAVDPEVPREAEYRHAALLAGNYSIGLSRLTFNFAPPMQHAMHVDRFFLTQGCNGDSPETKLVRISENPWHGCGRQACSVPPVPKHPDSCIVGFEPLLDCRPCPPWEGEAPEPQEEHRNYQREMTWYQRNAVAYSDWITRFAREYPGGLRIRAELRDVTGTGGKPSMNLYLLLQQSDSGDNQLSDAERLQLIQLPLPHAVPGEVFDLWIHLLPIDSHLVNGTPVTEYGFADGRDNKDDLIQKLRELTPNNFDPKPTSTRPWPAATWGGSWCSCP